MGCFNTPHFLIQNTRIYKIPINSLRLSKTLYVFSRYSFLGVFRSGIHITSIPALTDAIIPCSLSSNTIDFSAFEFNFSRAFKKTCGFGLPISISSENTKASK